MAAMSRDSFCRGNWGPFAALVFLAGCRSDGPGAAQPPATVNHPVQEADLASVALTAEAERRLGIEVEPVVQRRVPRTRTVGGEVIVASGGRVALAAPRAGLVLAGPGGQPLVAGQRVAAGQVLFQLVPLASESELVRADQDLAAAAARLEQARLRYERIAELVAQRAATPQELDDAAAELAAARATHEAVRRIAASAAATPGDSGLATPVALLAPRAAVVAEVLVQAGQQVSAGTPLATLESTDPLWVRVPVYVGDLPAIDPRRGAQVQGLGEPPGAAGRRAEFITGPPTADPLAAASDLYFRLSNPDGRFRPGERVAVTVLLDGAVEARVIPWTAVVHDIQGGTWVYVRTGPHRYQRRRVSVTTVVGDRALLAAGPVIGDTVVSVGAMELFSTEFGPSK